VPTAAHARVLLLLSTGLVATRAAGAQVGQLGAAQVLSLVAVGPSVLGVTVISGAVQSIPSLIDGALNSFPSPVVIQTNWNVSPGQTAIVNLVAYFPVPAQALTGGGTQIPSSRVLGRMATGLPVAFTAMTQAPTAGVGTSGGSLQLFAQPISGGNKQSSRTDNLDLELDLAGFPALRAGAYSGTLTLQAVTQ
jgi:hypothetical protein